MSRILIVDDEAPIRCVLGVVCKGLGHQVDLAENGLEAIELLKQQAYEVVITNLKMMPMSGSELAALVRLAYPQTKIITMTGWATSDAEQVGADRYFVKPFYRDQFVQALNELLPTQPNGHSREGFQESEHEGRRRRHHSPGFQQPRRI
ncbi:MAG: response regulator [Acidobacteria bacterium]|nr:response regulator [Acidobacteriota bacterium]